MSDVHRAEGTRDFLPAQMSTRLKLIERLRHVFVTYGFEPLETPAVERIETLTGKYGDEGERLIYKILKRGEKGESGAVDLALRYDLTVPLARVCAMHKDLAMPFKRHQVQPVWRADRPQKGRYREFWQCDVDTVGSDSPVADAECIAVIHDCMVALGFEQFQIHVNHRGILRAMAEAIGAPSENKFLVALDKLDKIGRDGVREELVAIGIAAEAIERLWPALENGEVPGAETGRANLDRILGLARDLGVRDDRLLLDFSLARGLDYYTGAVWEVRVTEPKVGSLGGGGRYDDLVGMFAGRRLPAVGSSLGIDRIALVMEETGMWPVAKTAVKVWVTTFGPELAAEALRVATVFRRAGVATDLTLEDKKLGKQLKALDQRGVPFAVVVGPDEVAKGVVVLKQMSTGEQWIVPPSEAVALVQRLPAGAPKVLEDDAPV
jgi:histidyl-tRNA synthetase